MSQTLWLNDCTFWWKEGYPPYNCYTISDYLMTLIRDYVHLPSGKDNDVAGLIADRLEEEGAENGGLGSLRYDALIAYMRHIFYARSRWGPCRRTFPSFVAELTSARTETSR